MKVRGNFDVCLNVEVEKEKGKTEVRLWNCSGTIHCSSFLNKIQSIWNFLLNKCILLLAKEYTQMELGNFLANIENKLNLLKISNE